MDKKSQVTYGSLMGIYSGRSPGWCVVNRAKYLSTDLANAQSMLAESKVSSLEAIAIAEIINSLQSACKLKGSPEFVKQLSLQTSLSG